MAVGARPSLFYWSRRFNAMDLLIGVSRVLIVERSVFIATHCRPVLRLCWGSSARYPANS
jgi:hypothetical protein